MSRIIASAAIKGAHKIVSKADSLLKEVIEKNGESKKVEFPGTAYYLPVIYALTGKKVEIIGDMKEPLVQAKSLLPEVPSEKLWLPYLGNALDAGIATLIAEEIIEALKFVDKNEFVNGIWLGPTTDAVLREQGIKLVDGRMPGFAACIGAAKTKEEAVKLARDLQERNILVFMSSHTNGTSMAEQLAEEGIEMNWDTFLVPYGKDTSATVHALGFAVRSAMTFGGITPKGLKEAREILLYNKNRVFAFVLALGEVDDEKYATAAGALNFGFPVIADTDIPQILPTGICTYEHVISNVSYEEMPSKAIEIRGVKIKITKIPIPVRYGPAFEGERIRKENLAVEFGGKYAPSFEYLYSRAFDEVEDDKIEVVGPEIDDVEEGAKLPIAIIVEVAGRKMQKDFESILERYFHTFINQAMGVMHIGQRDINWIRIGKEAKAAGLKIKHIGVLLRAKLLSEFPAIVDKVQVTIYTNEEDVKRLYPLAKLAYNERDKRMGEMMDESVDTFYSCTLCQSFAPNHVCIITPERLGLCGAYNWLDGKAAYEINKYGANQPIKKVDCLDSLKGKWKSVNDFVYNKSNNTLSSFSVYSMMDDPMTSCGCFECIAGVLPGTNGIMVVDREYQGSTPSGMTFFNLAEFVGGGQQTPGFIGIGTLYVVSKKFISGDGGLKRVVWMTKNIKEKLKDKLAERCKEIGEEDLLEKIADESITVDIQPLIEFLNKVNHPALKMEELV